MKLFRECLKLSAQLVELLQDGVVSSGSPASLRAGHEALVMAAVTTESRDRPPSIRKAAISLPAVWLGTMSP
jgi:hypothetical protein